MDTLSNHQIESHETSVSSETVLEQSASYYASVIDRRVQGPQLEGFTPEWFHDAMKDPTTRVVELDNGKLWPLLASVEHNHDYRKGFFDTHYPDRPAYYFSLPPEDFFESIATSQAVKAILDSLRDERGLIAYDYMKTDSVASDKARDFFEKAMHSEARIHDVTPESEGFGMEYGLPKVTHFEAVATRKDSDEIGDMDTSAAFLRLVSKGEFQEHPEDGPTVLTGEELKADNNKLLDAIWEMYHGQFDELVEDHPSLQIQSRDELESMLLDEDSFNIAYMSGGEIKALCYFVSNIKKCIWLNSEFYDNLKTPEPGVSLAYFPGIVVDKNSARQGGGYVNEMIGLIEKVYTEAEMRGMQIVFQCTNISETYIPKIVTSVITQNDVFGFDRPMDKDGSSFRKTAEYNYRILSVK